MTPLDRAREIIELRAKATQGEWFAQTMRMAPIDVVLHGLHRWLIDAKLRHGPYPMVYIGVGESSVSISGGSPNAKPNNDFIAHAANHAAEVAQAYIEAMQDNARLLAALEDAR